MHRLLLFITVLFSLPLLKASADEALARKYFLENDFPKAHKEYIKTAGSSIESFAALSAIDEFQAYMVNDLPYLKELCNTLENPSPLLYFVINSDYFRSHLSLDIEDEIEFLEECLERKDLHPQLRALLKELLSTLYLTINEYDKAVEIKKGLGTVDNWSLVGPFENISGSGFNKNYEPISKPQNETVFTAQGKINTSWFDYHEKLHGDWINLASSFDISEALCYAQSFIYSEKDQDIVLGFGYSGSAKLWINDELLFSEKRETNNGMDSYTFTAKLNKGYNRVLVQIGTADNYLSNFLLRFLDKDLNPLPTMQSKSEYQPYKKSQGFKSQTIPNFAYEYYDKTFKGKESEIPVFHLLSQCMMMNGQVLEHRKRVAELIEKYPDSFFVLFWEARNLNRNSDLESSYLMKQEYLKSDKFQNTYSEILRMQDIFKKEDWDRATEIIDSLESEGASDYFLYLLRAPVLNQNKEYSKYVDLTVEMHEKYPTDINLTKKVQSIYRYDKKMLEEAFEVYEDYLDDYFNHDMTYSLAQHYWQTDRRDDAEELLEKLLKYSFDSNSQLSKIANFYYQQALYDKALEYYYRLYKKIPYASHISSMMAECYREKDMKDSAIKYYEISLDLYPGNYDDRVSLRKLKEEKDIFEKFEEPDIDAIVKNAKGIEDYPDENAIILLMESHTVLYKSGAQEEIYYFMAKALTQTGVDMLKENNLGYGSDILKAEVRKKDGSIVQADKMGGGIVFTKLEPGDVIYYKVKSNNYIGGSLAGYYQRDVYFNTVFPLEATSFSLLKEDGIDIEYKTSGIDLKPEIKQIDGMTLYTWTTSNLPKIEPETMMPPINEVCAMLHISSIKDWDYVSKWYYDVSNPKTEPSYDVELKAKELFEGKSNLSDMEKVKVIYKYITEEIRYSSVPFRQSGLVPQNPTKTIDAKIGDCKDVSVLFVSLCKAVGLDAEIVLFSNRENGENSLALPSIGFEHVIGKIILDGKTYYVELTSDVLPFGTFYGSSKKAFGLEINDYKKNELFRINPETRPDNAINRYTKAKLENGNMLLEINSTKIGGPAASMRGYYRDQTIDLQRKTLTKSISEDYSSVELIDLKFDDNLKDLSDSVTYFYSYKVKKPYTEIKNMMIMKFPWQDVLIAGDVTSEEERDYPIALWQYLNPDSEYNKVELEIPKGMKVAEVPESVSLQSDFADYKVSYKIENNTLIGERTVVYKNDVIPAEKYQDFKKFYDKMVEHDNKQIAFEK